MFTRGSEPTAVHSARRHLGPAERRLEGQRWAQYFGSLSLQDGGVLARIEVIRDRVTSPIDGRHRPLRAISYDDATDVLEFAMLGRSAAEAPLRYFIHAPRTIRVSESSDARTIVVEDASGLRTLIDLHNVRAPFADVPRPRPAASRDDAFRGA
jgi:hypothetical protein